MATLLAASRRQPLRLRHLLHLRTLTQRPHVENGAKACVGNELEQNPLDTSNLHVNLNSSKWSTSRMRERKVSQDQMDELCHESALFTSVSKEQDRGKPFLTEKQHLHLDMCTTKSCESTGPVDQGVEVRGTLIDKEDMELIGQDSTYCLNSMQNTSSLHCNLKSKVNSSPKDPKAEEDDRIDPVRMAKPSAAKEMYIILDLNGVLIKRWDKNPSLPGVYKKTKKWVQLRPGCIEFLQRAFAVFHVGIWSTMKPSNVQSICALLEQQAHKTLPFFMVWGQNLCYQHASLRRPDKAHVPADFKPMSLVWKHFPHLGSHNTILVDDSPYKACMNNPQNCIFPDAFDGCTKDTFLSEMLWPYLEGMRLSNDIQSFILKNRLGQQPITDGHELYHHFSHVMKKTGFEYTN